MIKTKTIKSGQVVFREGETSKEAYKILSGRVAIAMAGPSKPVILAQLGAGDIFGEMGLVDERPRSASAVAVDDTTLEVVTLEGLNHMILHEPQRFIPYLSLFFERLRTMNDRLRMEMKLRASAPPATSSEKAGEAIKAQSNQLQIELVPATTQARDALGRDSLAITKLPFRIGRSSTEAGAFNVNDLCLADQEPFQISRSHCAIEREGDRVFIQDRGSRCGTIVNNVAIGSQYTNLNADLVPGKENTVVLGDDYSPYRFTIIVKT